MNLVAITGRTTADIELKETKTGTSYTRFTVACDRDYKTSNGEKETDFIPCVAWGQTAVLLGELSSKGIQLTVVGRFEAQSYENSDGIRQYMNQVNVNRFYVLESRNRHEDEFHFDN